MGTPKSRFRFNICFRISKISSLRRTILLYDTIIIICTRCRTGPAGAPKNSSTRIGMDAGSPPKRRGTYLYGAFYPQKWRAFPSCPWHFLYFTPKARKILRYFGPCRAFPPCSWHLENKGASSSIISPDELCVLCVKSDQKRVISEVKT